jgi:branched-chain amino acid transport system permease protein
MAAWDGTASPQYSRATSIGRALAVALFVVVLIMLPHWLPPFHVFLLTRILFLALAAMSFVLLAGFGGMLSLGQTAFYGLAGYAVAIGSVRHGLDALVVIPLGVLLAVTLGALFGALAVRTRGIYFLVMTVAFGQIVYSIALQWNVMTGGYDGLTGLRPPTLFGHTIAGSVETFYFTLVPVVVLYLALKLFVRSPCGIALQGVRDNPKRMAALGFNVNLQRYVAIVISSGVAGMAGVLSAYFYGLIGPDMIGLDAGVTILFVSLLGGVGHFEGAIVGATVYVLLEDIASQVTDRYRMIIGVLFVLIVLFLPKGIVGAGNIVERLGRWGRGKRSG